MKDSTCSPLFAFTAKGHAFIAKLFITNSLAVTSYVSIFGTLTMAAHATTLITIL